MSEYDADVADEADAIISDYEDSRAKKLLGITKFLRDQIACYDAYLVVAANEESDGPLRTAYEGLMEAARVAKKRWEKVAGEPSAKAEPKQIVERLLNQRPWSKQLIDEAQAFVARLNAD